MQFILRKVMQSRRLGILIRKHTKNVPLEINLATMEGKKRKTCSQRFHKIFAYSCLWERTV